MHPFGRPGAGRSLFTLRQLNLDRAILCVVSVPLLKGGMIFLLIRTGVDSRMRGSNEETEETESL